jgi:hypothetical protein
MRLPTFSGTILTVAAGMLTRGLSPLTKVEVFINFVDGWVKIWFKAKGGLIYQPVGM